MELLNNLSGTIEGVLSLNKFEMEHDNFVIVAPNQLEVFTELLQSAGVTFELITNNIQTLIDAQNSKFDKRSTSFDWNSYRTLEEFYSWYDILVQQYPDQVQQIVIGQSFEGRDIILIKISFKPGNPSVVLESGIHAREWISHATASFILNQLLTSNETSVRHIAENNDWYILPIYNPDGYVYTHNTNRLHRGNRNVSKCKYGVDLNRNFNIHWKRNACGLEYPGTAANSEPETRAFIRFVTTLDANRTIYIAMHAYSQMFAFPYGYKQDKIPNYLSYKRIAAKVIASLSQRYGTKYEYDDIIHLLYQITGDSLDYVYEKLKIEKVFVYELRPDFHSPFHFILPSNEIIPTGLETLDSIVTLIEELNKL